jgi:hypothetical protein
MSHSSLEIPLFYGLRNGRKNRKDSSAIPKFRSEEKAPDTEQGREETSGFIFQNHLKADAYSWHMDLDYDAREHPTVLKG